MKTQTILYIEDMPLNVQLIRKMLKFSNYDMLDAATGRSGLSLAQMHKPDLILMDVNLPDIDGLDLTALIKSYDTLHHIPIVALTADSSSDTYQRCLDVGCVAYLNKPVSKAYLLRVVQQVMTTTQHTHLHYGYQP